MKKVMRKISAFLWILSVGIQFGGANPSFAVSQPAKPSVVPGVLSPNLVNCADCQKKSGSETGLWEKSNNRIVQNLAPIIQAALKHQGSSTEAPAPKMFAEIPANHVSFQDNQIPSPFQIVANGYYQLSGSPGVDFNPSFQGPANFQFVY